MVAAREGNTEIVTVLIQLGAVVNIQDNVR